MLKNEGEPAQGPRSDGRDPTAGPRRGPHTGARDSSRPQERLLGPRQKSQREGAQPPLFSSSVLSWSSNPPPSTLCHRPQRRPPKKDRSLCETLPFHFHTGHTQHSQTRTQSPLKRQRSQTLRRGVTRPGQRPGRRVRVTRLRSGGEGESGYENRHSHSTQTPSKV